MRFPDMHPGRGTLHQQTKNKNWRSVTVFATSEYPKANIVNARTGCLLAGKVGNKADEHNYIKVKIANGISLGNNNGSKTLFFETMEDYQQMILVAKNDEDEEFYP